MARDNQSGANRSDASEAKAARPGGRLLGSLRDALAAASREESSRVATTGGTPPAPIPLPAPESDSGRQSSSAVTVKADADAGGAAGGDAPPPLPRAAEAAREARGGAPIIPPLEDEKSRREKALEPPPTTGVVRRQTEASEETEDMVRTERVRGRHKVERGELKQDPVVGWLVVVGGPGIGAFRPIFEGNNTVGRSTANRVPIDFGDEAISAEEQAYIRYDSTDRSFLLVPNLAKTNVVSLNDQRPAAAVRLQGMDVITMGHTQLVFVPFCGQEFDWSELSGLGG